MRHLSTRIIATGLIGMLLGALIVLGIRFANYSPVALVHYHANFAVYINGERQQFIGLRYYEETAAEMCSLKPVASPKERAHMHDNVNSVVHVEDHLVTWGNFMQNLGWGLGTDYLKTVDSIYTTGSQGSLSFVLNGKPVTSIADKIIQDKDRLLISYGTATAAQLSQQYTSVPRTAAAYDTTKDPASCGVGHAKVTTADRFHHLF
jgi:hypothetical protein